MGFWNFASRESGEFSTRPIGPQAWLLVRCRALRFFLSFASMASLVRCATAPVVSLALLPLFALRRVIRLCLALALALAAPLGALPASVVPRATFVELAEAAAQLHKANRLRKKEADLLRETAQEREDEARRVARKLRAALARIRAFEDAALASRGAAVEGEDDRGGVAAARNAGRCRRGRRRKAPASRREPEPYSRDGDEAEKGEEGDDGLHASAALGLLFAEGLRSERSAQISVDPQRSEREQSKRRESDKTPRQAFPLHSDDAAPFSRLGPLSSSAAAPPPPAFSPSPPPFFSPSPPPPSSPRREQGLLSPGLRRLCAVFASPRERGTTVVDAGAKGRGETAGEAGPVEAKPRDLAAFWVARAARGEERGTGRGEDAGRGEKGGGRFGKGPSGVGGNGGGLKGGVSDETSTAPRGRAVAASRGRGDAFESILLGNQSKGDAGDASSMGVAPSSLASSASLAVDRLADVTAREAQRSAPTTLGKRERTRGGEARMGGSDVRRGGDFCEVGSCRRAYEPSAAGPSPSALSSSTSLLPDRSARTTTKVDQSRTPPGPPSAPPLRDPPSAPPLPDPLSAPSVFSPLASGPRAEAARPSRSRSHSSVTSSSGEEGEDDTDLESSEDDEEERPDPSLSQRFDSTRSERPRRGPSDRAERSRSLDNAITHANAIASPVLASPTAQSLPGTSTSRRPPLVPHQLADVSRHFSSHSHAYARPASALEGRSGSRAPSPWLSSADASPLAGRQDPRYAPLPGMAGHLDPRLSPLSSRQDSPPLSAASPSLSSAFSPSSLALASPGGGSWSSGEGRSRAGARGKGDRTGAEARASGGSRGGSAEARARMDGGCRGVFAEERAKTGKRASLQRPRGGASARKRDEDEREDACASSVRPVPPASLSPREPTGDAVSARSLSLGLAEVAMPVVSEQPSPLPPPSPGVSRRFPTFRRPPRRPALSDVAAALAFALATQLLLRGVWCPGGGSFWNTGGCALWGTAGEGGGRGRFFPFGTRDVLVEWFSSTEAEPAADLAETLPALEASIQADAAEQPMHTDHAPKEETTEEDGEIWRKSHRTEASAASFDASVDALSARRARHQLPQHPIGASFSPPALPSLALTSRRALAAFALPLALTHLASLLTLRVPGRLWGAAVQAGSWALLGVAVALCCIA